MHWIKIKKKYHTYHLIFGKWNHKKTLYYRTKNVKMKKVRVNEMVTMHWIKLGITVHLKTIIL